MSLKIKLDKPINDYRSDGKSFVQPYHAYKAKITKVEETEAGWINVSIKTTEVANGDYDSLNVKSDSQNLINTVGKWANAVMQSNPALAKAGGNTEIDMSKWVGLELGIVYRVTMSKESNYKEESKWCEPHFAIPISQVEDWVVDANKYNTWKEKFWGNGTTKTEPKTEVPGQAGLAIDDDLPF